jgi:hypothetical protein
LYDDRVESTLSSEKHDYAINPATILSEINQNDKNVFTLMTATPETPSSISANSIYWKQDDYFQIAQTLQKFAWNEELDGRNLYSVNFRVDCYDVTGGTFTSADFYSSNIMPGDGDDEIRFDRWIGITPLESSVFTLEIVYSPSLNIKPSFDPTQYQITAEEALEIAEKQGGAQTRLKVHDECQVSANAPGQHDAQWRVRYAKFPHLMDTLFEVFVNPHTGQYMITTPEP